MDIFTGPSAQGGPLGGGEEPAQDCGLEWLSQATGDMDGHPLAACLLRWRTLEVQWRQAHESAAVLSRLLDSRIHAYLDGVGQAPSFVELMSVRNARFREQETRDEADDFMLRMLQVAR